MRCRSMLLKKADVLYNKTTTRQSGNKMGRQFLLLIGSAAIAGCTELVTSDYQPYEGRNNVYEGDGGTKVVVDGVDFWANGSPPRKYAILGVVTSAIGAGYGDE